MAVRPTLAPPVRKAALLSNPAATPARNAQQAAPAQTRASGTSKVPPSRDGRKPLNVWVDPDTKRRFNLLVADEGTSGQALLIEALNMLFQSRKLGRIAS